MNIENKLIEKWGEGKKLNNCWAQKKLSFISNDARLNILFDPISDSSLYKAFFKNVESAGLFEFYSQYNGCKLFSNSLCIYGIQEISFELYQTYDLEWENKRVNQMLNLSDYLVFGSLGGQYLFALKANSEEEMIYCMNVDDGEIVKHFDNFDLFFITLFDNLCKEYDANGVKIHKNIKFKNIKSLFNTTIEERFLEEN